jgi:hypothetical protein
MHSGRRHSTGNALDGCRWRGDVKPSNEDEARMKNKEEELAARLAGVSLPEGMYFFRPLDGHRIVFPVFADITEEQVG